jgi:hypothetical protein
MTRIRQLLDTFFAWLWRLHRGVLFTAVASTSLLNAPASANSLGSPACSVNATTMGSVEGNSVLPSPNGWSLALPSTYVPGAPFTVTLQNVATPSKTYRGILMWVQAPDASFQGVWAYPSGFQKPVSCTQASITHTSSTSKSQSQVFTFTPPPGETRALTVRAVITEASGRTSWVVLSDTILPRAATPLNIDGSTVGAAASAATDGMLLMRHMFGLNGTSLIDGVVDASATRNATTIAQYLTSNHAAFDVDGDGNVAPTSDGLLVLRYLLGLRGTALTQGAAAGTLPATEIERRIAALL